MLAMPFRIRQSRSMATGTVGNNIAGTLTVTGNSLHQRVLQRARRPVRQRHGDQRQRLEQHDHQSGLQRRQFRRHRQRFDRFQPEQCHHRQQQRHRYAAATASRSRSAIQCDWARCACRVRHVRRPRPTDQRRYHIITITGNSITPSTAPAPRPSRWRIPAPTRLAHPDQFQDQDNGTVGTPLDSGRIGSGHPHRQQRLLGHGRRRRQQRHRRHPDAEWRRRQRYRRWQWCRRCRCRMDAETESERHQQSDQRTDGNGILLVNRATNGEMDLKIATNTVGTPVQRRRQRTYGHPGRCRQRHCAAKIFCLPEHLRQHQLRQQRCGRHGIRKQALIRLQRLRPLRRGGWSRTARIAERHRRHDLHRSPECRQHGFVHRQRQWLRARHDAGATLIGCTRHWNGRHLSAPRRPQSLRLNQAGPIMLLNAVVAPV